MLKRLLFSACAALALTLSAQQVGGGTVFAGDDTQRSVTFGIRAGMNLSNYYPLNNKIGVNAGVNVDIPIYKGLYAQTGLYYSMKGAKLASFTHHLHYIHMPIMGSYHYNINPDLQLQGSFGPYFAVKVGSSYGSNYDDDYPDDIKTFDAGLQFGAGVTIKRIYLGLGYEIGLANIRKEDTGVHNRNFSINVGYNF